MQVPTREQLVSALRIPDIKPEFDRMGRIKVKTTRSDVVSRGQQIHKQRLKSRMKFGRG
jgi:hypothetical protein